MTFGPPPEFTAPEFNPAPNRPALAELPASEPMEEAATTPRPPVLGAFIARSVEGPPKLGRGSNRSSLRQGQPASGSLVVNLLINLRRRGHHPIWSRQPFSPHACGGGERDCGCDRMRVWKIWQLGRGLLDVGWGDDSRLPLRRHWHRRLRWRRRLHSRPDATTRSALGCWKGWSRWVVGDRPVEETWLREQLYRHQ